jgi:hypothetical protein
VIHRPHLIGLALLAALSTTACNDRFTVNGSPSAAPATVVAAAPTAPPAALPAVPVPAPATRPATPGAYGLRQQAPSEVLEVVDQGFSAYAVQYSGNVTSWGVKLRNPNTGNLYATGVSLRVTFTDATGAVVLVEEGPVTADVAPGQVIAFGSTDIRGATGLATAMHVEVVDTNWTDGEYRAAGQITMGPATARPGTGPGSDLNTQVVVDCSASSTFLSKLSSFFVSVLYLDAQGRIIGGSNHNSDIDGETLSVPGGGNARFTLEALFAPPSGVPAAECSPNFVRPTAPVTPARTRSCCPRGRPLPRS